MTGLSSYLTAVDARVTAAVNAPEDFHPHQRALLRATIESARANATGNPLGHPLSVLYLVAQAHGRTMDAQAEHVGAFCLLYVLSLDLFDDVQDGDLAGKPHEEAGPAIAINTALTLLCLAMIELRQAMALELDSGRSMAYLELYNSVTLQAGAGQHRDLLGADGAQTPEQVLAMQQAKTSSLQLFTECGALLARCDDATRARYRAIGQRMAKFVQIRDDLRDVFGKPLSPDLSTGRITYPVACLLAAADDATRSEYSALIDRLPGSMPALRTFLYRSGAVEASAAMLEELRALIHSEIAAMECAGAHHRMFLDVVDNLAAGVYRTPVIIDSARLWSPCGPWHDAVRQELAHFVERMMPLGCPAVPVLRPWHLPHWMYAPDQAILFYPDVEGLPRETLPFQSALLGIDDLDEVAGILREQLPAVVAHEMFHHWRARSGRISADHWHEEWVANRLAVAYCARFAESTLTHATRLAERVVVRHGGVSAEQESVLSGAEVERPNSSGYAMDMVSIGVVSLEMVRRQIAARPSLEPSIRALLGHRAGTALSA